MQVTPVLLLATLFVVLGASLEASTPWTSSETGGEFQHNEEFYATVKTVDMTVSGAPTGNTVVSVSDTLSVFLPGSKPSVVATNYDLSVSLFPGTADQPFPQVQQGRKRAIHPIDGPYTSAKVSRSTDWPFKMVGRLFFSRPNGETGSCSAAIIQKRLIVTAAHCIYREGAFNTEFEFVPGFVNGSAPFGAWQYTKTWVSSDWSKDPTVPSPQDFGIISLADRDIIKPGIKTSVGSLLGWFGAKTNALLNNHVTSLGYPSNHNNALIMHVVDSQFKRFRTPTNAEYPSDMIEGISGGPWIADFGSLSEDGKDNSVVGISSYRDEDLDRRYLGSSVLDSTFLAMYNAACKIKGNCEGIPGADRP